MRSALVCLCAASIAALAPPPIDAFLAGASPAARRAFDRLGAPDPRVDDANAERGGNEAEQLRLEYAAFEQVWRARAATASADAAWRQQETLEQFGDVYALEPCECSAGALVAKVRRSGRGGVALAPRVVAADAARRLRREVLRARDAAAAATDRSAVLGDILCPRDDGARTETRWDVFLDPSDDACAAVVDALLRGPVGDAFEELCGGPAAPLREYSAVVAAPGAPPQPIHADTAWTDAPVLFTCFVALQDVEPEHGPTRFLPNTATAESHAGLDGVLAAADPLAAADEYFRGRVSQLACLDVGDATLYDSRLHHAGGPCFSNEERVLFYLTFGHVAHESPAAPTSIAPRVAARSLTIGDFRRLR